MRSLKAFFRRRRKLVGAAALALAVVAIFWAVNSPAVIGASAAARALPVYSVKRDNKAVSLTFDAAWGNEDTQILIDILGKYGVKATFFLVGDWVDKYPESVKALYDAGMELGNHSDKHPHMASLSAEEIRAETEACNKKLEALTEESPKLFRCPYGEYDDEVIHTINDMGMMPIQWNVERCETKETPRPGRDAAAGRPEKEQTGRSGAPSRFPVSIVCFRPG